MINVYNDNDVKLPIKIWASDLELQATDLFDEFKFTVTIP